MRIELVLAVALGAAVANAACSRCVEDKAPPPAASVTVKESPAVAKKIEAPPATPATASDAGVPEATGPVGKVPAELLGVWEKTDQPFRGMRIEFGATGGMTAIQVVAPPADDAAAVAFYTGKNGNKKEVGAKFAECMPKIWKAGVTKYIELKPTARPDAWAGKTELHIVHVVTCAPVREKLQDLVLRLQSKDELVATIVDPKSKTAQIETWKRVKP
jgi:hypothetical protein